MMANEEVDRKKCKKLIISPRDRLIENVKIYFQSLNIVWNDDYLNDLPKKWKIFNDLVLFPFNSFTNSIWIELNDQKSFWELVAKSLKVKRVAKESRIQNDGYRTPNVEILVGGDNPWVFTQDNGIKYTFNITKCMFSSGNITEKMRVAKFNCTNQVVLDLFAGIGYFTIPYIVHAKASKVIACEWNPSAVEALKRNLELNKCSDKCEILEGDNRLTCPSNFADRINLGLIPTSEESWPIACRALKSTSVGYMHIHGNVDLNMYNQESKIKQEWIDWSVYTKNKISLLLNEITKTSWTINVDHIEYVKSYGPRVDHLVLDLKCSPMV